MELQIEKGVPIPPKTTTKGRRMNPIRELEVGDSVLIAGKYQENVASRAGRITRQTGRRFVTRKVEGGVRVWRVA
jgi:hypothetical protein